MRILFDKKKREQRSIRLIIKKRNYLIVKYTSGCALSLSAAEFSYVLCMLLIGAACPEREYLLSCNVKSERKLAAQNYDLEKKKRERAFLITSFSVFYIHNIRLIRREVERKKRER